MDGEAMHELRMQLGDPSERRWAMVRRSSVMVVVALCLAPGVTIAQSPSPSAHRSPAARAMLAASVAWPTESLPRIEPYGPPDAEATAEGIRLALWLPDEPVPAGGWIPATVVATNEGEVPIIFSQDTTGDPGCGPLRIAWRSAGLFDETLPPLDGNAAIFVDRLLGAGPFAERMIDWQDGQGYPCQDQVVETELAPGASLKAHVGAPAIHEWRSQPLPGGTARVVVGMSFDRARADDAGSHELDIDVSGDVVIDGEPPAFAGPGAFATALLEDEAFASWLETSDLSQDWTLALLAPELTSDDASPFPGGPAPIDPVEVEASAEGSGLGGLFEMTLDAWTAEHLDYPARAP